MAEFKYEALDQNGKAQSGTRGCGSEASANSELHRAVLWDTGPV